MTELGDFYDRYIAAFNACDHDAFSRFFHPPVTVLHATRYDDRRAGRALPVLGELSSMESRPSHWKRTTVESVVELSDAGPALETFTPAPPADRPEGRPGLLTVVTRWDHEDRPYQRIRTLYLLTREEGSLGIKVLVELDTANL
jgi:hypothetical protein